jgi:hypothetical protein
MTSVFFTRFKLRGGPAAEWSQKNPTLADREPGIETDSGYWKFGDGVTPWNDLGYANLRQGDVLTIASQTTDQKLEPILTRVEFLERNGGGGGGDGTGGVTWHGYLDGLGEDDHTIYALADGSRGAFAPVVHTHGWADVTGKPLAYPPAVHSHSWAEITDKPVEYAPGPHSHLWDQIDGKPTTFPATAHSHPVSDVTGLTTALDGKAAASHTHTWAEVSNKPAEFPPATHGHTWAQISGTPSTFPPSAHTHTWADVTGKPTTFAPAAHTHTWADVTAKPDTFPPDAHTHAQSDVIGLDTALAGKASTAQAVPPGGITGQVLAKASNTDNHVQWTAPAVAGGDGVTDHGMLSGLTDDDHTLYALADGSRGAFAPTTHSHPISGVTGLETALDGKSDTSHTHTWASVTAKPATYPASAHTHTWTEVTAKPTTFPPDSHAHPLSDVTGLADALEGKSDDGHTHGWTEVTDKPATYPAAAHSHTWAEVTAKPTEFPPAAHDHVWADLTDKPSTYPPSAHTHAWTAITAKPTEFPPSDHTHTIVDVDGLTAALEGKADDAQVLPAGGGTGQILSKVTAADYNVTWVDPPVGGGGDSGITDHGQLTGLSDDDHPLYALADGTRGAFAPTTHTHTWASVTGKPTEFTPAAHDHIIDDVTGLSDALDGKAAADHAHTWAQISGKPTTFPADAHTHSYSSLTDIPATFAPSGHSHAQSDITGLATSLSGKSNTGHAHSWADITSGVPVSFPPSAHTHLWADLTDKPTTFAPAAHSHAMTDVTGLDTALSGKANTSHTHLWAHITDKPSTFAPSAHTHLWADLTDKPTTFTPAAHTHLWADITDKPTTFTPAAHIHSGADITTGTVAGARLGLATASAQGAVTAALFNRLNNAATAATVSTLVLRDAAGRAQFVDPSALQDAATKNYVDTGLGTKAATSHTHAQTDVTGLTDALAGKAAAAHTHAQTDITGLATTLAGKSDTTHSHTYAAITDKPSSFTPSAHTHPQSDITGLSTALSGKSDTGHTHAYADITGTPPGVVTIAAKPATDLPSTYPEGISIMPVSGDATWPAQFAVVETIRFGVNRSYQTFVERTTARSWRRTPDTGDAAWLPWIEWGAKGEKGDQGATGTAATITGATASGLAAGAAPTVTAGGTPTARSFAFGIPAGAKGDTGEEGRGFTPRGEWTSGVTYSVDDIVTASGSTFRVTTNHTSNAAAGPLRGINSAGGEFAHQVGTGTYGNDYHYDSQESFNYFAAQGHRLIRLPFLWERVQPTRGAALDSALLGHLTDAVTRAGNAGLSVLLDVHNYGRRHEGGVERVMGTDFPYSDLIDLWARLSTVFKDNTTVVGYGLMNEPHNLPGTAGPFTGTTVYNFDTNTQGWSGEGTATATRSTTVSRDGGGSLAITRTDLVNSGGQTIRANDSGANTMTASGGKTIRTWVYVPAGSPGEGWQARIEVQNNSWAWTPGPDHFLTPGVWTQLSYTPSDPTWADSPNPVAIQFSCNNPTATTATVYVDTIEHGGFGNPLSPVLTWEKVAQDCVNVIRANADTTPIYIPGFDWSSASRWPSNHPTPFITDPNNAIIYEAHYYFDRDNSGDYPDTFAAETADATSRGWASLAARAVDEINNFTDWCTTNNVRGLIGEIGWPNTGDTTGWNAVGEAIYDVLDAAGIEVTYWAAGERWGNGYNLGVYTGSPQSAKTSIAGVVEAHPTLPGEGTPTADQPGINMEVWARAGGTGTGGSTAWGDVTDKPTTFPPDTHTHAQSDVTGLTDALAGKASTTHSHAWNDITSKPTTFPPSTHSHAYADITDKPSTFAPAAHTHLWADISDKPTTFAPATHTHDYTTLTNIPATFAPSAHTHAYSSLSGIPTEFTPAAHTHAAATTSVAGFMSTADKTKLDQAVSANTASRMVIRDAAARAQFADPSALQDAATKNYVDTGLSGKAATSHTHTTAQVTGLDTTLAGKLENLTASATTVPSGDPAAITVTGTGTNRDLAFAIPAGPVGQPGRGFTPRGSWAPGTTYQVDDIVTSNGSTFRVTANHTSVADGSAGTVLRGINIAGAEFGHTDAPGVYGTNFHYDSQESFNYIASRGHKVVRLPFLWERVQTTRGQALDPTLTQHLVDAVTRIHNAGMTAILDMHNYCRRHENGVELVMGRDFPPSDLVDVWDRLSVVFKDHPGVEGYGLMNEPYGLLPPGTIYNFENGTEGWVGTAPTTVAHTTAGAYTGSGALSATRTNLTNAPGQLIQFNDNGVNTLVRSGGAQLYGRVFLPNGSPGTNWRARLEVRDNAGTWHAGSEYPMSQGGWTGLPFTPSEAVWAEAPNAIGVRVICDNPATATATVYLDTFQQFPDGKASSEAGYWEETTQDILTAIRANGDNTTIFIPGYGWSAAKHFHIHHSDPWITDPANNFIYEAHFYFDQDNSGDYPDTYATENSIAVGRGYVNLADQAVDEMSNFTDWCSRYSVKGYIGELGWPNNGDTAGWNSVGEALYDLMDANDISCTYWAAGEAWGTGYILSAYTGTPQNVAEANASVIEAHLGSGGGADTTTSPTAQTPGPNLELWAASGAPGSGSGGEGSTAWEDITGKPITFTPSDHTHAAESITSGTLSVERLPEGLPRTDAIQTWTAAQAFSPGTSVKSFSVYPDTPNTPASMYLDNQSGQRWQVFSGSGGQSDFAIYNKSAERQPFTLKYGAPVNTLVIGPTDISLGLPLNIGGLGITNLADPTGPQEAATKNYIDNGLTGKANSTHSHAWADITSGVPTTFAPSAHTHLPTDISGAGTIPAAAVPLATASAQGAVSGTLFSRLNDAVSTATASRLAIRDASGRTQFADPAAAADAATKGYTDTRAVPTGGTTGQILSKTSATNYATQWVDPPSGGGGSSINTPFAVRYTNGAWEYTTLAAAQTAGLNTSQTVWFIGNPGGSMPAWARTGDIWTQE